MQRVSFLIDSLLIVSGCKRRKAVVPVWPRGGGGRPAGKAVFGAGVAPLEIEPHVQRAVVQIGQRRVFIAHKTFERASAQPQQLESADRRLHLDEPFAAKLDLCPRALGTRWEKRNRSCAIERLVRNLVGRYLQTF